MFVQFKVVSTRLKKTTTFFCFHQTHCVLRQGGGGVRARVFVCVCVCIWCVPLHAICVHVLVCVLVCAGVACG